MNHLPCLRPFMSSFVDSAWIVCLVFPAGRVGAQTRRASPAKGSSHAPAVARLTALNVTEPLPGSALGNVGDSADLTFTMIR